MYSGSNNMKSASTETNKYISITETTTENKINEFIKPCKKIYENLIKNNSKIE